MPIQKYLITEPDLDMSRILQWKKKKSHTSWSRMAKIHWCHVAVEKMLNVILDYNR